MAPAPIKSANVKWFDPISLKFGFTGLADEDAISIVREGLQNLGPIRVA